MDAQGVNPYEGLIPGENLFEWVGDGAWGLNNYDPMTLRIKDPVDSVVMCLPYRVDTNLVRKVLTERKTQKHKGKEK